MLVSSSFSLVIYRAWSVEMDRFAMAQKTRLERRMMMPVVIDEDVIEEAKRRVVFNLIAINGFIWLIGAGAGYVLAGKTLWPIELNLEEQRRFVSDAGHELKTPITALKTNLEVYLRGKKQLGQENEARELIKESLSDVNRLHKLVESLLFLNKAENHRGEQNKKRILVVKIIDDAINRVRVMSEQKQIVIDRNRSSIRVKWEYEEVVRLVVILLDNAIKYSRNKSKIKIKVKNVLNFIEIAVIDSGEGIAADQIDRIFDRFYRTDKSRTGDNGFGLGLAIAKRTVENMGGKVWAVSKLGSGSTFFVRLPRD